MRIRRGLYAQIMIATTVLCLCAIVAGEGMAWAYIDPGSGGMLWQLAVGALAAAAYFVRGLLQLFRQWAKAGASGKSSLVDDDQKR